MATICSARPFFGRILAYHEAATARNHLLPLPTMCREESKSFMAYHGAGITKTHDLVSLNKTCREYDPSFALIENDCLELTDYGVQVRYPFQLELTEADVALAIQSARRIAEFVTTKVLQP